MRDYLRCLKFFALVLLLPSLFEIGHAQNADLTRYGDTAVIKANTWRPMCEIAKKLADEYGIRISAEDPNVMYGDDLEDTTDEALPQWRARHPNERVHRLKPWSVEVRFRINKDGTPENIPVLLHQIIVSANANSSFSYRLNRDDDRFYTFVPTHTRDATGAFIESPALLDLHVSIPAGTRTVAEHAALMASALAAQTGFRVDCCEQLAAGLPWGGAKVAFEAHDLSARQVLEQLIDLLEQSEPVGSRYHWLATCDPAVDPKPHFCFINVFPVRGPGYSVPASPIR